MSSSEGNLRKQSALKAKERLSPRCAYCGNWATTSDHTPPRALLAKPLPTHTVTVPACQPCNVSFSFDERLFKIVLAHCCDHSDMIEARTPEGSVGRALAKDRKLWELFEGAKRGSQLLIDEEVLQRMSNVILKTARGLYNAVYGRFVDVTEAELICFRPISDYSVDDLVNDVRPPQVVDITDQPLPEITPSGWALKGQAMVVTTLLLPVSGGEPIEDHRVLWVKQETPIEWIDYQPSVFKFGFVGSADKSCICVIEVRETFVCGVRLPWPSGRGSLRRGRRNPFSRERLMS